VSSGNLEEEWSIGIFSGESPLNVGPVPNLKNPVLTWEHVSDIPARFVADPFMIRMQDKWYMFFEIMNKQNHKGEIGLAESDDALQWKYQQVVLAEPFHLSYPYVFEWMNEHYMIPESYMAGAVRLYKASEFPRGWSFAANLLSGPYYADPSILRYDDRWWLFVDASSAAQHDTLRLFWSEDLTGFWREHPMSPIVAGNPHIARPAGRMVLFNQKPLRFAQDCYPNYGTQVHAFEITELTIADYREREAVKNPIIKPSRERWNKAGMHQIDPHPMEDGRWIACVDGLYWKEASRSDPEIR
jgi:hypothetical protein